LRLLNYCKPYLNLRLFIAGCKPYLNLILSAEDCKPYSNLILSVNYNPYLNLILSFADEFTATPFGSLPTDIVAVTVLLDPLITLTVLEDQ